MCLIIVDYLIVILINFTSHIAIDGWGTHIGGRGNFMGIGGRQTDGGGGCCGGNSDGGVGG